MTWPGTRTNEDQRDLVRLVDDLMDEHAVEPDDRPDWIAAARTALADAGLWTLGVPEEHGGGGAGLDLRLTALAAIGSHWAALGWASAQTHAAAELLEGHPAWADVVTGLHTGEAAACVVDAASAHVDVAVEDGRVSGSVDRVDPAGERPHVLVLIDDETAWVLPPDVARVRSTVRRTGLDGAMTIAVDVSGSLDEASCVLHSPETAGVSSRLRLGAAAVATGIALRAAELSLSYSHSRWQFGAPLTALPTVRGTLFEQASLVSTSMASLLAGDPSASYAAATLEGCCERAVSVAAAAVQSHGGYGYLAEYGVERLLRDAVSLRAATDSAGVARRAAGALAPAVPTATSSSSS